MAILKKLLFVPLLFSCFNKNVTNGAHKHVPRIGYGMYKKNFKEPKTAEGFKEIKKINFVPNFGEDKEKEKMFYLFT